jgi:predicted NBD/HSP70 family sugar kinase
MRKRIGQPKIINRVNRDLIKEIVAENSPVSKPQIAKISRLSLPTVNKTVEAMEAEGIFKRTTAEVNRVGRKAVYYEINGDFGYIVALYIENEYANGYIRGAIVDLLGEILYCEDRKTDYSLKATGSGSLFGFIDFLIEKAKEKGTVKALTLGVPAVIDDKGNMYRIPNIIEWEGVNLKDLLEKRYLLPAYVENDVNLTSIGILNKYFPGKPKNIVYMYFGEGIGAGVVIRGKLYKGKFNFAGEFSHMVISNPGDNDLGQYKQVGLFSRDFLPLLAEIMEDSSLKKLLRFKEQGGEVLRYEPIKRFIQMVSHVIINMIVLLNPEVIAIRGFVFNNAVLNDIGKYIIDYVGKNNLPELLLIDDNNIGLEGTIRQGLAHSVSNYSFINDKGI